MAKKKKKEKEMDMSGEEVNLWAQRISRAEQRRDELAQTEGWVDIQKAFRGEMSSMIDNLSIDPRIKIPEVNLLWAIIKTNIPALSLKNPHFEVNPRKGSSILSAKIRELAINYVWRQKRMKRQISKNLQEVETIGHTWFKTGYTGKFGTIEDGNGYLQEYVESEDYFGYRVSWKDITFNPEAVDPPHDCRWIAHRFFRPLEDVKSNEKYKQSTRDELQGSPLESNSNEDDINHPDSFTLYVKLYEVHDIANGKRFTIAEGVDDYLEDPHDYPYDLRGTNFSFLAFNDINDQSYPVPEAKMYLDQIVNHVKIRFQQLDHVKRGNRQYEMPKNYLDEESKRNLSLGITGAVHEHNDQNGGKLQLIGSPSIPVDSYTIEQRNLDDLSNIAGQSPFDRGATGRTTTRTIGEIFEIQRGARNRSSEKVARLEEFLSDIARNLLSLIMQFGSEPFYVELTGKEPEQLLNELALRPSASEDGSITSDQGFTFTKKDIQGEFDVSIKPGSTIELDRETKLELLQRIAEFAPPLIQSGGPVAATIGRMFAEELDWPELGRAIEEEIKLAEQRQKQAEERAQELQQIQAAQFGAEKQLEADKIQSKNTGDLIKFATATVNAQGGKDEPKV